MPVSMISDFALLIRASFSEIVDLPLV